MRLNTSSTGPIFSNFLMNKLLIIKGQRLCKTSTLSFMEILTINTKVMSLASAAGWAGRLEKRFSIASKNSQKRDSRQLLLMEPLASFN